MISPTQGLLKIVAVGKTVYTSRYGNDLKTLLLETTEAVAKNYGPAKTYDFLRSGSLWDESQDWMMGLKKEERTLASYWKSATPSRVSSIFLEAKALSMDTGYLSLSYEFEGFTEYAASKKDKAGTVF